MLVHIHHIGLLLKILLIFYEFMDVSLSTSNGSFLVAFSLVPIALVGYLRLAVNILFSSRPPPPFSLSHPTLPLCSYLLGFLSGVILPKP